MWKSPGPTASSVGLGFAPGERTRTGLSHQDTGVSETAIAVGYTTVYPSLGAIIPSESCPVGLVEPDPESSLVTK